MIQALKTADISTEIYYPLPLHAQECFADIVPPETVLPNAEKASKRVLALPVYPELTEEMLNYVVSTLIHASSSTQPSMA